jgi:hypothetical protein
VHDRLLAFGCPGVDALRERFGDGRFADTLSAADGFAIAKKRLTASALRLTSAHLRGSISERSKFSIFLSFRIIRF